MQRGLCSTYERQVETAPCELERDGASDTASRTRHDGERHAGYRSRRALLVKRKAAPPTLSWEFEPTRSAAVSNAEHFPELDAFYARACAIFERLGRGPEHDLNLIVDVRVPA
jgi:hypothetical protein